MSLLCTSREDKDQIDTVYGGGGECSFPYVDI